MEGEKNTGIESTRDESAEKLSCSAYENSLKTRLADSNPNVAITLEFLIDVELFKSSVSCVFSELRDNFPGRLKS